MGQVTDIKQVKADLVGRYAIQLSKVLATTEILAEHYHKNAIALNSNGHVSEYADCGNSTCISMRELISDSRQMISQGV